MADDVARGGVVEDGVEEIGDLLGVLAQDGFALIDQALVDEVDGDFDDGVGGALAGAGLEDPEGALLDGEFDVLHVAEVGLESVAGLEEAGVGVGHGLFQGGRAAGGAAGRAEGLGGTDAGDHVFALGVEEELAEEAGLAALGVAAEGDRRWRSHRRGCRRPWLGR